MPQGLQILDSNGVVMLDADTLLGRVLGILNTGLVDGSLSVPAFLEGTPFYYAIIGDFATGLVCVVPEIVIHGGFISWKFVDYTDGGRWGILRSASTIVYGII